MSRLAELPVLGWSLVSAVGEHHYVEGDPPRPLFPLESGLTSHRDDLGIPGHSGRYRGELPGLPPALKKHESRAARLLLRALGPLRELIAAERAKRPGLRLSVVLGSSTGGIDATESALKNQGETGAFPREYDFEAQHPYGAFLALLEAELGPLGPSWVISTACSSAGKALGSAARLLRTNEADLVLSGGVDALCELTVRGFAGLGILSPEPCRPFAKDRKGISIGEGAALVLVSATGESEFRLVSVGESNDAYHATTPHPEGLGARLAMTRALAAAEIPATRVAYVNAHGTGTQQNDTSEAIAIRACLGDVPFSSTKHLTGHLLGAAGGAEVILCLEALRAGKMPSSQSGLEIDPGLAATPLVAEKSFATGRCYALSNSFAFGGNNVSVLVARAGAGESPPSAPPLTRRRIFVQNLSLSGEGFPSLGDYLKGQRHPNAGPPKADLLPPRARGRASGLTRLCAELLAQLKAEPAPPNTNTCPLFFGSALGEMKTTLELLAQLGKDPALSPAKFQASVHNTAAGILSLLEENRTFATAISAGQHTFEATLFEAWTWLQLEGGEAVVLVGDSDAPEELLRGRTYASLGVGVHLKASENPPKNALAEISGWAGGPWPDLAEGLPLADAQTGSVLPWVRAVALGELKGAARPFPLSRRTALLTRSLP